MFNVRTFVVRHLNLLVVTVSLPILVVGFQNCSGGFQTALSSASSGTNFCATNSADPACLHPASVKCTFNGIDVPSDQSVLAFLNSTGDGASSCQSETRTCSGGVLTGTYGFATCTPSAPACLFNGRTITSGSSVVAYLSSAVASGGVCQNETRNCTSGVLSGNYSFGECTVGAAASCLFNGQTVPHGASITAFTAAQVAAGQSCQAQTRTCYNGALTGVGDYATCNVATMAACLFNSATVASGQSITAYATSTVPAGQICQAKTRTCTNGTLSGTGDFGSCVVNQPASCLVGSQTIPSGGSATFYFSKADSACASEVRTCVDGHLSGMATENSCVIIPAIAGAPNWFFELGHSCNAEGLLWSGPDLSDDLYRAVAASSCFRLSRAVETWNANPDLDQVRANLSRLQTQARLVSRSKALRFGAFLAEAINYKQIFYTASGTTTNVTDWCQPNSIGHWGPDTCIPNAASPGYQIHITQLAQKLIEIGITDFQFGELGLIDPANAALGSLIQALRSVAAHLNTSIMIGGQPNGPLPPWYLQQFDYIVGPSHIDPAGNFEENPAGPMWNDPYNNNEPDSPNVWATDFSAFTHVFTEIDWFSTFDDTHHFASLTPERRRDVAFNIQSAMQSKHLGWVYPISQYLNGGVLPYAGTCIGQNQYVYSEISIANAPSGTYTCQSLDFWNSMMDGTYVASTIENTNLHFLQTAYKVALGRDFSAVTPADATWMPALQSQTQKQVYTAIAGSDEASVVALYQKYLNRNPGVDERQYWVISLGNGTWTRDREASYFQTCSANGSCK